MLLVVKNLFTLSLLFLCVLTYGQTNNSIFSKGSSQGNVVACFTNPPVSNSIFNKGGSSGIVMHCFIQNEVATSNSIFTKGTSSGYFMTCYTQADAPLPPVNNSIFGKGSSVSSTLQCFVQSDALEVPQNNNIFGKGSQFGSTIYCVSQADALAAPVNNNIFNKGASSGSQVYCISHNLVLTVTKFSDESLNQNSFNVYPNPATNKLMVAVNNLSNSLIEFTLSDITGMVIYSKEVKIPDIMYTHQLNNIDGWLRNGAYVLRIKNVTTDEVVNYKILIMNNN